jgi:hypothetical protein
VRDRLDELHVLLPAGWAQWRSGRVGRHAAEMALVSAGQIDLIKIAAIVNAGSRTLALARRQQPRGRSPTSSRGRKKGPAQFHLPRQINSVHGTGKPDIREDHGNLTLADQH